APLVLRSFPTRRSSDLLASVCVDRLVPIMVTSALTTGALAMDVSLTVPVMATLGLLPLLLPLLLPPPPLPPPHPARARAIRPSRSEEHTSELQSRGHLV